ncbi:glycosyltransferase [Lysobacter sp. A6]|uniref:Glycosyltransferase n=1 Tax=Noviluteimonas lactosilytica TaxID=2888523 RepID=A0ABS8JGC0_9GAMM|nr:glycosyltransferase [Lysobacter lactosilyticus]MCC8362604.1 glycosyltransferase [Lysobacter lactosilyticus]
MRLLLVAYDFPPMPSPQAIRWAYLARELANAGHDVQVLAPDLVSRGPGMPELPASVVVHRVYPGPLAGFVASRQRRQPQGAIDDSVTEWNVSTDGLNWKGRLRDRTEKLIKRRFAHGLNWKGHVMEVLKAIEAFVLYPDARTEWLPWARKRLDAVLDEFRPDAVITSHEPANTLQLGLQARERGFRWIADLGDPVLAPYTPRRWRRRAHRIERATCERADLVTVTSARTCALLAERHGLPRERCLVLTQGYDATFDPTSLPVPAFDPQRLELLYTGSFYAFRRVDALLHAIAATPGVRLNIASAHVPSAIVEVAATQPGQVRLFGFVSHRRALALQRKCDVLVNIANDDPVQVPGKLYEYLGAGAPILQVGGIDDDAGAQLVRDAGLGWCERGDADALAARLRALLDEKARNGRVARPGNAGYDITRHAWHRLASTLVRAIETEPRNDHAHADANEAPRIAIRGHR